MMLPKVISSGALMFCVSVLLSACTSGPQDSSSLEDFAERFREANDAENVEPMLALYELEGSSKRTISLLRNALLFELGLPIQSIEFEPLSGAPEEQISFTHQGIRYGPTLQPKLRMQVRYATEDGLASNYTIGKNAEDNWRIVSSRPSEEPKAPTEYD